MSSNGTVNIVVAGLGGQGVVKASDILADAAFRAGYAVKKSEIHGMSQRGGSVSSDVRYGGDVLSPMVPAGEADYLVVTAPNQVKVNRHRLREGGTLIKPRTVDFFLREAEAADDPALQKCVNVALLAALSVHLDIPEDAWRAAIRANLPARAHETNVAVFSRCRETLAGAATLDSDDED